MPSTLIIAASPRKGGNTDLAASLLAEGIGGARVVRVHDLRIKRCEGCRRCMKLKRCAVGGDDFERLWRDVLESDLIGIVSPVYWLAPPGAMKDFIDRTHGGYARGKVLSGRRAFLVSIAADSGFETHEQVAESWLRSYGAEVVGSLRLYAREKDDLRSSPGELKKLEEFRDRLAGRA